MPAYKKLFKYERYIAVRKRVGCRARSWGDIDLEIDAEADCESPACPDMFAIAPP